MTNPDLKQCCKFVDPSAGKRGSNKFWMVEVNGKVVDFNWGPITPNFHFGKIGTFGQSLVPQTYPTKEEALKYANKKLREKINGGYICAEAGDDTSKGIICPKS